MSIQQSLAGEKKQMTKDEVFKELKRIFKEVAPLKIVDEVTYQSSLVDDFAFDSIDIMGTLLKIKESLLQDLSMEGMNGFLGAAILDAKNFQVDVMCQRIIEARAMKGENNG